jgi:uncharacterized membrane protein
MTVTTDDREIPPVLAPLPAAGADWRRHLPLSTAFGWLAAGWRDFIRQPGLSLVYGLATFAVSLLVVYSMVDLGYDYILFPALSGFLVIAPMAATGLYEKSRRLAAGRPVTLSDMLFVRVRSGGQIAFVGLLLCLLMVLWNRAATLLYALVFGLLPFSGLDAIVPMLLDTSEGWTLLGVGSFIGGIFAAFSFSISVFAVPRLLAERTDALTAMGQSMALVWNNLALMLTWAAIIVVLFGLSVATGLLGLIVVFPVLGHATWHAFTAMRGAIVEAEPEPAEDASKAPA